VRCDRLYVSAVAACVPPVVAAATDSAFESVAVSGGEAPPEMAVRATREAMERSGVDPSSVALVVCAQSSFAGHDAWISAPYVQRLAIGGDRHTLSLDVHQLANGGMAAVELAAGYLAGTASSAAVIAAAERFSLPRFDRWRSFPGAMLGDGAAALVLSRTGGLLRLLSIASVVDPELEGARRGDRSFAVFDRRSPLDLGRMRREFIARLGADNWARLTFHGRRESLRTALHDAEVSLADIAWIVLPHLGASRLRTEYWEPFGLDPARTTWESFGRRVGHLGAVDPLAGLDFLVTSGRLRPGDRCLILSTGGDVVWSSAVVQVEPG
jgi:3-oxoacyl-[acyl-carrier-protein] synthase III